MLRTLFLLLVLFSGSALAQQVALSGFLGVSHFSVGDLARGLDTVVTRIGTSVQVRTSFGILTLWTDDRDYLWLPQGAQEPTESRLALPVTESAGELWAPIELLENLGATISGVVVVLPDRTRLVLAEEDAAPVLPAALTAVPAVPAQAGSSSEVVELANGVRALRITQGEQSVLLVDLGLLGLAYPERRVEFDSFNASLNGQRPLYFVLSSGVQEPAALSFSVRQPGMSVRLEPQDGVVTVQGEQAAVGPGQPVSGVLLLPPATNLRGPLQVEWQQVTTEMVFRR